MTDAVLQMVDRMRLAKRPELLMLLAAVISEITIFARAYYDEEDARSRLRRANEAIHRVPGHLRDLCNPNEAFTDSRVTKIGEQLEFLRLR